MDEYKHTHKETKQEYKLRMKAVLDFLREGMSLRDSLVLAEVTVDDFEDYKQENPRYEQLVERKQVEYKREVVKAITKGIEKDKDPKMAQWLAEVKYSDEYSKKKKDTEQRNPITNIIALIQQGRNVLPSQISGQSRHDIKSILDHGEDRRLKINPDNIEDGNELIGFYNHPNPQINK